MDDELALVSQACLCLASRKLARQITRDYNAALEPAHLKTTQLHILVAALLARSATMNTLAAMLSLERTTLTRNLRLLEKEGFVRKSSGADARQHLVSVTPAGQRAVARALPLWHAAQARVDGSSRHILRQLLLNPKKERINEKTI